MDRSIWPKNSVSTIARILNVFRRKKSAHLVANNLRICVCVCASMRHVLLWDAGSLFKVFLLKKKIRNCTFTGQQPFTFYFVRSPTFSFCRKKISVFARNFHDTTADRQWWWHLVNMHETDRCEKYRAMCHGALLALFRFSPIHQASPLSSLSAEVA